VCASSERRARRNARTNAFGYRNADCHAEPDAGTNAHQHPEPRVIEVEMDQELQALRARWSSPKDYLRSKSEYFYYACNPNNDGDIYLIAPGFASVNGWGFVLYPKVNRTIFSSFKTTQKRHHPGSGTGRNHDQL
jgi:hypothetical protein